MGKIRVHRKAHHRKGYTRKDGTHVEPTHVKATTYYMKDRGEPGRTPESEQWFDPQVQTGWDKDMPADERRKRLHKGGASDLTAARRAQALANVSTDMETRRKAAADADYLFQKHNKNKSR